MSVSPFPQSNPQHHYSPICKPSLSMVCGTRMTKVPTVSRRLSPASIARLLEQPYIPNHPPILPMGPRPSIVANLPPHLRPGSKQDQRPKLPESSAQFGIASTFLESNRKDGDSEEEDSDEEDDSESGDELHDSENNKESEEVGCRRYGVTPAAVVASSTDIEMSDSTSTAASSERGTPSPQQPSEDSEGTEITRSSPPSFPSISGSGRCVRGGPDHRRTPLTSRLEEPTPIFADWNWNMETASVPISAPLRAKATRTPSPLAEPRQKSIHDSARPQAHLRQAARHKYGATTPKHSRIIDRQ